MRRSVPLSLFTVSLWLGLEAGAQDAGAPSRAAAADRPEPVTFPVVFHVPEDPERGPVVDRSWMEARLEWSNRIFEPTGVQFRLAATRPMDKAHLRMETRRDRHALGGLVRDGVINCFAVASLRDVDDPSRFRQGVHWRSRTHEGTHYVIISRIAHATTLAHELGHFFGNRQHRGKPGNIMSYERGDGVPFFNERQMRRIHHFRRRYLRTGELRRVPMGNRSDGGRTAR